jgi:hypothetical protein
LLGDLNTSLTYGEYFYRALHDARLSGGAVPFESTKWVTWRQLTPLDFGDTSGNTAELRGDETFVRMMIYGYIAEVNASLPDRTCELWSGGELLATFTLPSFEMPDTLTTLIKK